MVAVKKAIFNWSGGKDSSLALYHILKQGEFDIKYLLTTVNSSVSRISMHGVRTALLKQQAESIGLPLNQLLLSDSPSMEEYNKSVYESLQQFKGQGIDYSIFGDIFLEDLRLYREQQLARVQMQAVFPIWKRNTTELLREFIDLGFKAVLVCVNEKYLDSSFAGCEIDADFIKDLPLNVDPCGENGEYHSFVYDGPIFKQPIKFGLGETVHKTYGTEGGNQTNTVYDTGFYYRDLLPVETPVYLGSQ